MPFTSLVFLLVFLPVVWLVNLRLPQKISNAFLAAASLLFYLWGEQRFFVLLILSILFNYGAALLLQRARQKGSSAFPWMVAAVACNLGVLAFYKYTSFSPGLPLGISFFTFQALSYVLDVYYQTVPAEKNPLHVALYISFFPKLLMGPMTRYSTLRDAVRNRRVGAEQSALGLQRFILGMAKKLVISSYLGGAVDQIFANAPGELAVASTWIGAVFYCLQLFFDLSGYSNMAVGLSMMFGFSIPENFNYPFISTTVGEYWRRWHITLSDWFRTYLYIPLARTASRFRWPRSGKRWSVFACDIFALFFVWSLIGLWHGPGLQFMIHGLWQFFWILLERVHQQRLKIAIKQGKREKTTHTPWWARVGGHCYLLLVVALGQVFFRAPDAGYAVSYLGRMFGVGGGAFCDQWTLYWFRENLMVFLLAVLFSLPVFPWLTQHFAGKKGVSAVLLVAQPTAYFLLLLLNIAYMVGGTYQPFLYLAF